MNEEVDNWMTGSEQIQAQLFWDLLAIKQLLEEMPAS